MISRRFLLAGLAAVTALALPLGSQAARRGSHVILISLDGFAADYLNDPRLPIPNIRGMAAGGAHAKRMTVSTPSVTWPNHTTLVTGVPPAAHGVLANGMIEPTSGGASYTINPRHSREEMCRVPTLYDAAKDAGLRSAEINWPVTRGSKALDFSFPDHPEPINHTTPSLVKDLVDWKLIPAPTNAGFGNLGAVGRDHVWTQSAIRIFKRDRPNLLLLHLLNTDGQQHAFGPQSTEAYTALAMADRFVGDVLQAVKESGRQKDTTVIVTADHGFVRVTRQIKPNARLRARGYIGEADGKQQIRAQSISEGGVALVYFPGRRGNRDFADEVAGALAGMEGIDRILKPADYGPYGLPLPDRYAQAPDLVLAAKDGYAFSNDSNGAEIATQERPTGSHGYLQSNPRLDAILVMSGRGIRKGASLERARNLDVAPTIASLLDIKLTGAQGRPLTELLSR